MTYYLIAALALQVANLLLMATLLSCAAALREQLRSVESMISGASARFDRRFVEDMQATARHLRTGKFTPDSGVDT